MLKWISTKTIEHEQGEQYVKELHKRIHYAEKEGAPILCGQVALAIVVATDNKAIVTCKKCKKLLNDTR